jgi:tRNA A37 threonylcarbamoyladenosine dehydratase
VSEEIEPELFSVALTTATDAALAAHLEKGPDQEDLCFAYWRPSRGRRRLTAVVHELVLPREGERILQGNVAFTADYLARVLATRPQGAGIAFLHSHLGPGWQGMSGDDVVAERDRLAGPVWGQTGLPVLGLTRGTDGAWSARFWRRRAPRGFERLWVDSVRVVGRHLRVTYHPCLTAPPVPAAQAATVSVWGERAQADLARSRVGIVGLGSVGSVVAEALARVGFAHLTLIDFDVLEGRNLDRTAGVTAADIGLTKVEVAARTVRSAATTTDLELEVVAASLLDADGLAAALDCDVLISCVDRPRPRHLLNAIAYAHLIPIVDGGIAAGVKPDGTPLHVDWRIHTVGPDNACLVCMDALRRSDVALDIAGRLDDPDYINKLPASEQARFSRRNVYPFSLSVAAHEVLQLVGLLTGFDRISGTGPQHYRGYPGVMEVSAPECVADCEYAALTASAADLSGNLRSST